MANKSFYTFMKIKPPDLNKESLAAFTRKVNEQFEMSAMKLFGNIESKDLHPNLQKTIKAKVGNETFETYIQQTAHQIELLATKEEVNDVAGDVNGLSGTVSTHTTQIQQNAEAIALKADQTTVNAQGETISSLSSQLSLVPGQITAEVTNKSVHVSDTPPSGDGLYAGRLWQNTLTDEQLRWRGLPVSSARSYAATKSGPSVTFEDLSDDRSLNVTVKTIAQQAGSGTPSPTNPRAISGMASVDIAINASRIHTLTPPTQLLGLPSAMDTIDTGGNVQHLTDKIVLDGSGDWWVNPAWTGNAYRLADAIPQAQSISGYGTVADLMCSHFPAATPAAIADGALGIGIGNGTEIYVGFPDESVVPRQDIAALKAYLAAHPVVLVYRLATPFDETVAPVEIAGADGVNTITSDGTIVTTDYAGSGWALVSAEARKLFSSSNFFIDESGMTVRHVLVDGVTPYEAYTRLYGGGLEIYESETNKLIGGLVARNGKVYLAATALTNPGGDGSSRVDVETLNDDEHRIYGTELIARCDSFDGVTNESNPSPVGSINGMNIGSYNSGVWQGSQYADEFYSHIHARGTFEVTSMDGQLALRGENGLLLGHIANHLWPKDNGAYNLGNSSTPLRWRRLYCTQSPDVSSDARLKQDIVDLNGDLIMRLRPRAWRLKADPQNLHFGLIAQEVKEALDACGIEDADLYGDENPDSLSLRYEELIAPLIAFTQQQHRRIEALESRLEALEARLTKE